MNETNERLDAVLRSNGIEHTVADAEDLQQRLHKVQQDEFAQIWLERGMEIMSLLTNRDHNRGYLMFLTDDNPAGFHAVSGEAEVDGEIKFVLDNGQADEFDLSDTVTLSDGIHALEYFFLYGGRTSFVLWHDDSL